MEEWEQFKVGEPSRSRWVNTNCVSFDAVTHTSHIDSALAIIRDQEIRPSLVFDESKLNKQRVLVCWLSPNSWNAVGSRYGNVDFRFDFRKLIEGRNYYWIESIAYKITACRILITDIVRDLLLPRYDPTLGNGPWRFDESEGTHYFNNNYCLEFMVEAPIPLSMLASLNFTTHSDRYCALNRSSPNRCSEFGLRDIKGAARFVTRLAVVGVRITRLLKDNETAKRIIKLAVGDFAFYSADKPTGDISADSSLAVPLARAAMSAYTYGRSDEAKSLAGQFENPEEYAKAVGQIMTEITGVTDWFEGRDSVI
jgi:hypothetical protein